MGSGAARGPVAVRVVARASGCPVPVPAGIAPPGSHVQSWYDEVKDYTYPTPTSATLGVRKVLLLHTQVGPEERAWPQPGTPGFWGSPQSENPCSIIAFIFL